MTLGEVVQFLDGYLAISEVQDASMNGLQVEGDIEVRGVALAVDACLDAIDQTVQSGDNFLLVHHGIFWGSCEPVTGRLKKTLKALISDGISLYAAHLPLDVHPKVGNNAVLAEMMGVEGGVPFGERGLGIIGDLKRPCSVKAFANKAFALGDSPAIVHAFGGKTIKRLAVVTGSGSSLIRDAVLAGADCLLTGEAKHQAFHEAKEWGLNVVYAGHYATETVGLRALGQVLRSELGIAPHFLDIPTGL